MKQILVLGAGLSAKRLVDYLLKNAEQHKWFISLADIDKALAEKKINNNPHGKAIGLDVKNDKAIAELIQGKEVVVSLLPAIFHDAVAVECLKQGVNMATASYVSPAMKALDAEAKAKGLVFLNELGVDPGIDHMSAMQLIDKIREKGGKLTSFYSFTGGLIAPESDTNPWHYKFTWNPRNVVLAGQGVSQFIKNGRYKYIPYHKLFDRILEREVPGFGKFEIYPNRDSLKYRKMYKLDGIQSMYRGTMRRPGFAKAWNAFVQLGCTDDSYTLEGSETMTYKDFINTFLRYDLKKSIEDKLVDYLGLEPEGEVIQKLRWLGIFDDKVIGLPHATPAQILQKILIEKWSLNPQDKDMIVMQHEFEYELTDKKYQVTSSMAFIGKDTVDTAMAFTVGTPLAIAVKLLLSGKIKDKGVLIPTQPEFYNPILKELKEYGLNFVEKEVEL